MQREGQQQSNYNWQMRVLPATRTLPGWDEVEVAWDTTGETVAHVDDLSGGDLQSRRGALCGGI